MCISIVPGINWIFSAIHALFASPPLPHVCDIRSVSDFQSNFVP